MLDGCVLEDISALERQERVCAKAQILWEVHGTTQCGLCGGSLWGSWG